jgi:signal peptidase I
MMGDNRNNSSDSRIQSGGGAKAAVPVENVLGKSQFIVLPPTRWQGVDDPNPQAKAMGAPAWQSGAPAGVGLAAAFPAVWAGRKLVRGTSARGSQE